MGGPTTTFSDIFSLSPTVSPHNHLFSAPESIPTIAGNTTRDLDGFPSVARRASNAPPSSPTSSPERNTWSLLPHEAKLSSSRCPPLAYLDEQLEKVRPQACQGGFLDLGCEQAGGRFSFKAESYDSVECSWTQDSHGGCLLHDDDSTMVDPYSRVQSVCSEAGTFHEDTPPNDTRSVSYATYKASLDYDNYPKLHPSDPKTLRHTMPSPPRPKDYIARPLEKHHPEARRSYGLHGSPSVPARRRQISLPILQKPSTDTTMDPHIPSSASIRVQSWHASPHYSPSRKPPKPPLEMEKSIFEDYDEDDSVEDKKLPNRFRHLMRKLHCG